MTTPDPRTVELLARALLATDLPNPYPATWERVTDALRDAFRDKARRLLERSELLVVPADTARTGWTEPPYAGIYTVACGTEPFPPGWNRVIVAPDPRTEATDEAACTCGGYDPNVPCVIHGYRDPRTEATDEN